MDYGVWRVWNFVPSSIALLMRMQSKLFNRIVSTHFLCLCFDDDRGNCQRVACAVVNDTDVRDKFSRREIRFASISSVV